MNEIEEWNKWLLTNKGINVQIYLNEYKLTKEKQKRTLKELLEFVSIITFIPYFELIRPPKHNKSRGGSNNISRSRGYIVKAILDNKIPGFSSTNVYKKVFNFNLDHSTALHHKNIEHMGEELILYNKIENYIKTYDIQWEH